MRKATTFYQIYKNEKGNKVGRFLGLIPARNAKEALKGWKKICKIKSICVKDYGIRFLVPLTKGVFYYE